MGWCLEFRRSRPGAAGATISFRQREFDEHDCELPVDIDFEAKRQHATIATPSAVARPQADLTQLHSPIGVTDANGITGTQSATIVVSGSIRRLGRGNGSVQRHFNDQTSEAIDVAPWSLSMPPLLRSYGDPSRSRS